MSWADVWSCLVAIKNVVSEYQTLIAGCIAIVAAYLTARPVWKQLTGMNIQANTLLRNYVLEQLRRVANRRTWYSERLRKFNEDTGRRIYEMDNFEKGGINPHWAADNQQRAAHLLDQILKHGETRDLSGVEGELTAVKGSLSKLIDTLDSIHRPFSMDQHDEDHCFTDQQWADLKAAGEKAEGELAGAASDLSEVSERLDEAFAAELRTYQKQLSQIQALLKGKLG